MFPFAILDGRRHFAWRPVLLEDGRPAWLRFVFRLNPVAGIVPTFGGQEIAFTDRMPHCDPGIRGWLRAGVLG